MNAEEFQALFTQRTGVELAPVTAVVPVKRFMMFICPSCGCLFWPDADGLWPSDEVRLDWYMPVPFDNGRPMCQDLGCKCHLVNTQVPS